MLSAEANERLTRVGVGTPCGELMRRYWIPIAPYAQLLEDPVRKVRVLGEDLVLYQNTQGGLGLIGDRCLHRLRLHHIRLDEARPFTELRGERLSLLGVEVGDHHRGARLVQSQGCSSPQTRGASEDEGAMSVDSHEASRLPG